jgi:hypothetical protein
MNQLEAVERRAPHEASEHMVLTPYDGRKTYDLTC